MNERERGVLIDFYVSVAITVAGTFLLLAIIANPN